MKVWAKGYRYGTMLEMAVLASVAASAQTADGNAGINQANTLIRSYYDTATNLMYAVAGIMALVGAIRVYIKIQEGGHDTGRVAFGWFGACIFLVVVATVIKSFFGL